MAPVRLNLLLNLVWALAAFSAPFPQCLKTRCALDIGSSAVKLQVANVDACSQTILKTVYPGKEPNGGRKNVPFTDVLATIAREKNDGLRKSQERTLIEKTVGVLRASQQIARGLHAEPCRAVATATFRENPKAAEVVRAAARASGVPITIISAEREGQLEVYGALARSPLSSDEMKRAVVWGLGSTSQQWTPADGSPGLDLKISALGFRDRVLEEIKRKKDRSPNPMSSVEVQKARALADKIVDEAGFPPSLRAKLAAPDAVILGIGGTLNLSVRKETGGGNRLTLDAVHQAIEARIGKTDSDPLFFGTEHAPTQLTNLILVESFFRKLGMHEVRLVETDLTDGVLVHPEIWK